jgi:hypothetical protein
MVARTRLSVTLDVDCVLFNLTATSIVDTIGSYHQREMSEARVWTVGGMVLTDETRSNRANLSQRHSVYQTFQMDRP